MKGQLYHSAKPRLNLLTFEVLQTSEVDVSVYQPTISSQRLPSSHSHGHTPDLVDLTVLVMQCSSDPLQLGFIPHPTSCTVASGSHLDSTVTCSCVLKPGHYVVLPLAFNHWCHLPVAEGGAGTVAEPEGEELVHTTALFAAKPLLYSSTLWSQPGFLAESLFLLAVKVGERSKPFPDLEYYLYNVSLPRACHILVAENKDSHAHFTVTADFSESVNIVSTRGELVTIDCIPPHHRQVLVVLINSEHAQWCRRVFKVRFQSSNTNLYGQWGAIHIPRIHPFNEELHNPRIISH